MRPLSDYDPRDALAKFGILKKDDIKVLDASEVEAFKAMSQPFEYRDELGVVSGYRKDDGDILVTHIEVFAEGQEKHD